MRCFECGKQFDFKNDEGDYRYWPADKENAFCNDCLAEMETEL